jgi:hypothetical protein
MTVSPGINGLKVKIGRMGIKKKKNTIENNGHIA